MLKRRNSKRTQSLTTAYTGVNTPPPNAMQPSSAALAAASSVEAIKAQEQAATNANRRSSSLTSSGFAPSPQQQRQQRQQQRPTSMGPGVRRTASLTARPASSYGGGGLHSSPGVSAGVTHHAQPAYRSSTKRVTNPDRTQSLTTTTVRKLGSFEITTTNVVPLNNTLPRRPQPPKKAKAVTKKKSAELVPPRRAGYASSILSYDSELNAVEEEREAETIEGRFLSAEQPQPRVRPVLEADLKHEPPPRSLSPMKSVLKDSSRSGSVVSVSSQDERQARRNTRVSFTQVDDDETDVQPITEKPRLAVPNSAAKLASNNIATSTKMKQKIMTTEEASKKNQTSSAAFAAFTKNQEQHSPPQHRQQPPPSRQRGRPSAIGQLISKDRANDDTSESGNSLYSDAFEDPVQANLMDIVSAPAPHSSKGKKKAANHTNSALVSATAAAKGAASVPVKVEAQRKPSLRQRMSKTQPKEQQPPPPVFGTALSSPPRVASPRSPLAAAAAAASDKHAREPRTLRRDDPLARSAAAASNDQSKHDLAQREFRQADHEIALENGAAAAALREGEDLEHREELERRENGLLQQAEKHHSSLEPVNEDEVLNSRTASPSPPSTRGRKVLGSPIQSAKVVDDDASSIDSDDSWRARREARRKQGGGGFAGFRRNQEIEQNPELYRDESDDSDYEEQVAPRGDTPLSLEAVPESPEAMASTTIEKKAVKKTVKKKTVKKKVQPRPVSAPVPQRPLTAQELAAQMMKTQRLSNTDYVLKRTPSNSSFERTANGGGEKTGFSLKTMRTNSNQSTTGQTQTQPQTSYFNHPITETRSGSRFKSRFEDSDSDDDFALPPLPESPLDQPMQYLRTTAASPASAPPGRHQRSNSGGMLKGVFSPNRETKFLVKKHNSVQEMRGDGGFSSTATANYDSHFRTHMTGGPSDNIAPMKKKKFMGLRKVFGLKD